MSSLSHSMLVRSGIARVDHRHRLVEPFARKHEAAYMLGKMAREAEQLARKAYRLQQVFGLAGSRPASLMCASGISPSP